MDSIGMLGSRRVRLALRFHAFAARPVTFVCVVTKRHSVDGKMWGEGQGRNRG